MRNITLLIQASHGIPIVALAQNHAILFDSSQDDTLHGSRDYRALLNAGLHRIGKQLEDISLIGCDIGPGGMGVTRTSAAFANGLSFACSIPLRPIRAFELIGAQVSLEHKDRPIVILRRAGRPYVHFGLFQAGKLHHYEHCKENDAIAQAQNIPDAIWAGNLERENIPAPILNVATAATMLALIEQHAANSNSERAYPIVETLK